MAASYPTSARSFTTKTNGTTADAAHINDVQEEVKAVEDDLIAGLPLARGGTGLTALAANRIPYSNGSAFTSAAGLTFDGTTLTAPATTITQPLTISGASAGQIVFPATQNASTNANTLDDYKEGTWTPTIGGSGGQSGQAYTTQVGTYVKIGKRVTCDFNIVLSTLGTVTTNAQIQGLPFTSQNTTDAIWTMSVGTWANFTTAITFLSGVLAANATVITLRHIAGAAAVSTSPVLQADLANTTQIVGSISYTADA